jgi:hypothetical protein
MLKQKNETAIQKAYREADAQLAKLQYMFLGMAVLLIFVATVALSLLNPHTGT